MSIQFLNAHFSNPIILASSPLTESASKIKQGELHGVGGAILKTCCDYTRRSTYDSRKVIFSSFDEQYYAYSSFEREILTMEEGLSLYQAAVQTCSIPIIPSVTALSLNPDDWLPTCLAFQTAGASMIQLDLFYMQNFLDQPNFAQDFCMLLETLVHTLSCPIMPKVNIELPANFIFKLIAKSGVRGVSLLDSIRVPVVEPYSEFSLPFTSTSFFGEWQLPLSLHYAYVANQYGLEVCGGGGIHNSVSVEKMQKSGATLIQVASTLLLNGYSQIAELLSHREKRSICSTPILKKNYYIETSKCIQCYKCIQSLWCEAISCDTKSYPYIKQELCENCGWCATRCPANAIMGT